MKRAGPRAQEDDSLRNRGGCQSGTAGRTDGGEANGAPRTSPGLGAGPIRGVYLAAGWAFVVLGVVGAVLPVLPTTPFLILAAACFARSSPRLERWLLEHPQFGPVLREWRLRGAIPRRAKMLSLAGMCLGYVLFLVGSKPSLLLAAAVALLMLVGLAYVFSRPS
jgi:uncharacterized membrane protein YbaN (DUF454 family)